MIALERFAVLVAALFVVSCLEGVQGVVSKTAIIWTGFGHNTTLGDLIDHRESVTHVSVIAYMIDTNGTFACSCDPAVPWQRPCNNNGSYVDCPWWDYHIRTLQKHNRSAHPAVVPSIGIMPCITLPPGYDTTGLDKLMNSSVLQDEMIIRAVSIAVERDYAGYNIDWEGDTSAITSQELAVFLGRFRQALAEFNKTLSFDVALPTYLWNTTILAPSLDEFADMGTYGVYGQDLAWALRNNIPLAPGVDHYGMGLLPPFTNDELAGAFGLMAKFGVVHLWTWPDGSIAKLPPLFWSLSAQFLKRV